LGKHVTLEEVFAPENKDHMSDHWGLNLKGEQSRLSSGLQQDLMQTRDIFILALNLYTGAIKEEDIPAIQRNEKECIGNFYLHYEVHGPGTGTAPLVMDMTLTDIYVLGDFVGVVFKNGRTYTFIPVSAPDIKTPADYLTNTDGVVLIGYNCSFGLKIIFRGGPQRHLFIKRLNKTESSPLELYTVTAPKEREGDGSILVRGGAGGEVL
jgi:hypothetical protein